MQFSGEESYWQFLDLHALYEMYLNLTFVVEKITYTEYVMTFDRLASFPPKVKNAGYRKYVHQPFLQPSNSHIHPCTHVPMT